MNGRAVLEYHSHESVKMLDGRQLCQLAAKVLLSLSCTSEKRNPALALVESAGRTGGIGLERGLGRVVEVGVFKKRLVAVLQIRCIVEDEKTV